MTRHIALLRGINLGKRRIKMDDLRLCFFDMGFSDAETLIASGNVVFLAAENAGLVTRIEAALEARFGFDVPTVVRAHADLAGLRDADPFGGVVEDKDTKLYVFFLADDETGQLSVPLRVDGDYELTSVSEREICAIAHRQPDGRFGKGLDKLTKPFSRRTTFRNWNTVLKLIEMSAD